MDPVPRRHVPLGDGDEAGETRLGGEQIVGVLVEAALVDVVANPEDLSCRVVEKRHVRGAEQALAGGLDLAGQGDDLGGGRDRLLQRRLEALQPSCQVRPGHIGKLIGRGGFQRSHQRFHAGAETRYVGIRGRRRQNLVQRVPGPLYAVGKAIQACRFRRLGEHWPPG